MATLSRFPDWSSLSASDRLAAIAHVREAGYVGSMSVEYCWRDVPWERAESAHAFMRKLL